MQVAPVQPSDRQEFDTHFPGQRQNVPDPDKEIKRVREQFEMYVYEREDS